MRALRVIQQRAAAIRERVGEAVLAELGPHGDLVAAARRAQSEVDAEIARALARDPSHQPECASGCSHCCHVHVDASRGEVTAIAAHLREVRTAEELSRFVAALSERVQTVAAMDHEARWRAKLPCALLDARGRCSIYEVRPLRCRAFHSYSREGCRDAFAGTSEHAPLTDAALDRACDAVEEGHDRALEARGLATTPVLLEAALLEALSG